MLSWALDHRDDIDGIVLPLNQIFTAPPELEQLVEHLLGTDMFGLMMEDAHAAGALARELLGNEVTGGELSLISLQGEKVVYQQAGSGTRLLDELDYEDDEDDYDDEDDFDEELDEMYETTCPKCGNTIRFDYDQAASEQLDCPNCGAHLEFSLEDDDAE